MIARRVQAPRCRHFVSELPPSLYGAVASPTTKPQFNDRRAARADSISMTPQISIGHRLCGFRFSFANGVSASVQFGEMHHCSVLPGKTATARNAEVAAYNTVDHAWRTRDIFPDLGDDVAGHQSPEEVASFLVKCAALPAR